eukprot:3716759-Pyramimonas_sp.AAC.1
MGGRMQDALEVGSRDGATSGPSLSRLAVEAGSLPPVSVRKVCHPSPRVSSSLSPSRLSFLPRQSISRLLSLALS